VTRVSASPEPSTDKRPLTWRRPADISRELVTLLRIQGLTRLYWSACTILGVISITPDLTVWTDGRHLTWTHHGTRTSLPIHDTHHAAEHLAHLTKQPTPPTGDTP
jgi:hypothetical protein